VESPAPGLLAPDPDLEFPEPAERWERGA